MPPKMERGEPTCCWRAAEESKVQERCRCRAGGAPPAVHPQGWSCAPPTLETTDLLDQLLIVRETSFQAKQSSSSGLEKLSVFNTDDFVKYFVNKIIGLLSEHCASDAGE
ncbi:hypothetical protein UY3_17959 [Chelonia mydas]|uniref:Uncharacterized protein n=1 Tax=Chelonia mydas TaxID=8469 RepID=M7AIT9_CHEMY|nr:hypothetical protein UY3_17959 [Chelonia mydas]